MKSSHTEVSWRVAWSKLRALSISSSEGPHAANRSIATGRKRAVSDTKESGICVSAKLRLCTQIKSQEASVYRSGCIQKVRFHEYLGLRTSGEAELFTNLHSRASEQR